MKNKALGLLLNLSYYIGLALILLITLTFFIRNIGNPSIYIVAGKSLAIIFFIPTITKYAVISIQMGDHFSNIFPFHADNIKNCIDSYNNYRLNQTDIPTDSAMMGAYYDMMFSIVGLLTLTFSLTVTALYIAVVGVNRGLWESCTTEFDLKYIEHFATFIAVLASSGILVGIVQRKFELGPFVKPKLPPSKVPGWKFSPPINSGITHLRIWFAVIFVFFSCLIGA